MSEAMLTLFGRVVNVFVQPGGTSKKTGEVFEPRDKVQLLGEIPLPTGDHRLDLVTLSVEDATEYKRMVGKAIRVPVGVFAAGRSVTYFIPRGGKPQPVTAA